MIAAMRFRLQKQVPALRYVAGGAEFVALKEPPKQMPAAYVLPWTVTARPNNLAAGGFRQRVEEAAAVFILHRNVADARGDAAFADLDPIIRAVRAALVGWRPGEEWEQVETRSGKLFDAADGVLAWQEIYATASQLRTV